MIYGYIRVSFFFQAADGIRYKLVTGVQTCALPISLAGKIAFTFTSGVVGVPPSPEPPSPGPPSPCRPPSTPESAGPAAVLPQAQRRRSAAARIDRKSVV